MGEPISLASGLLTLATFALQSSVTLYDTIKCFQSHLKRVCDLQEELEALSEVLGPLTDIVNANTDSDLGALKLPLLRCGNACKEFERELLKCSSRSSADARAFEIRLGLGTWEMISMGSGDLWLEVCTLPSIT
jgi:hypothetical protein